MLNSNLLTFGVKWTQYDHHSQWKIAKNGFNAASLHILYGRSYIVGFYALYF